MSMKKPLLLLLMLLMLLSMSSFAQMSIEQQIADSACACISQIDTALINSKGNGMKITCLQKAMLQNEEAITKAYTTEKRKKEDEEKIGLKGSLMIKVQNILATKCRVYQIFQEKIHQRRTP